MPRSRHLATIAGIALLLGLFREPAFPQTDTWVVAWAASAQGPYPVGNPSAQPDLRFAFPAPENGATEQSLRMIVRPDIWGTTARIRLSNAFGTRPVQFDDVYLGLQASGSALVPHSNTPVLFGGKPAVSVMPGTYVVSDSVTFPFAANPDAPLLTGRKLAVSFHVAGESGPLTWHAKALTTSYLTPPGSGSHGAEETESGFPFSTTSWYFLDAVEMKAPPGTKAIVALGDSITDGTASTLNGDDRWPDVFARRVHATCGNRFSIVNAGIGGNMVTGPANYAEKPFAGGPSALERLERDVMSLSGVSAVIWLEGINDFGLAGAMPAAVEDDVREGVRRLRDKIPGIRIFMGTLVTALHNTNPNFVGPSVDEKRKEYNQFIRTAGIFDGVIDFDAATVDPSTGELKAEFQPNSTLGGPGDKLHPNRAGYAAMGEAVDLGMIPCSTQ
jgi:lysophospholipase L1-like esterase